MDFNVIYQFFIVIGILYFLVGLVYFTNIIIEKNKFARKNKDISVEIKNKELEIQKMKLFMEMDPMLINKEIDDYVSKYVEKYIFKQFVIHQIQYINDTETETMIRSVTGQIAIEISELYVFYFKILYNISDENDLVKFINLKVKDHVLEKITDYNASIAV